MGQVRLIQLFVAQKTTIQIAVEVKSFASASVVYEFHQAVGQYLHYRMVLRRSQPQRISYVTYVIQGLNRFSSDADSTFSGRMTLRRTATLRLSRWLSGSTAIAST